MVEEINNWTEDLRNIVIEPALYLTDPSNCLQVNKNKINRIIDYLEDITNIHPNKIKNGTII